jgi:hypothetical protein
MSACFKCGCAVCDHVDDVIARLTAESEELRAENERLRMALTDIRDNLIIDVRLALHEEGK